MFDTEKFIELVKERPCLWKFSSPMYHDKEEKRKAYEEVAEEIFDYWETLSETSKTERLSILTKKWKNVRDCFRKELIQERRGIERKRKRKYMYTDLLDFLRGQKYKKYEENNNKDDLYESDDYADNKPLSSFVQQHKKKTKTSENSPKGNSDFQSLLQHQDQDMAFFQSILSNVHKLNDQQRMEFRLDVLNALKKFQEPST